MGIAVPKLSTTFITDERPIPLPALTRHDTAVVAVHTDVPQRVIPIVTDGVMSAVTPKLKPTIVIKMDDVGAELGASSRVAMGGSYVNCLSAQPEIRASVMVVR